MNRVGAGLPGERGGDRWVALVVTALLLLTVSACEEDTSPPAGDDTVLFRFDLRGARPTSSRFVAATSDTAVIAAARRQLALPPAERFLHIHGPIARGNGGHNLGWNWHFQPDRWVLVEVSIELCDGRPELVEAGLDYWVDEVGYFCPWSSYVEGELPARGSP